MLIVLSQSPFANTLSQEALELSLGLASVGLEISLLFIGDGVEHLTANSEQQTLATKNFLKNLNCLELYDITEVYVCESSLRLRNIPVELPNNWQICAEPLALLPNYDKHLIL